MSTSTGVFIPRVRTASGFQARPARQAPDRASTASNVSVSTGRMRLRGSLDNNLRTSQFEPFTQSVGHLLLVFDDQYFHVEVGFSGASSHAPIRLRSGRPGAVEGEADPPTYNRSLWLITARSSGTLNDVSS